MSERIVYDNAAAMIAWAEAITPTGFPYRPDARPIGLERGGRLEAVLVFDTFSPWDCQVHICAEGRHWVSRQLWQAGAAFAFLQCGYRRVSAQISVTNLRALSLARAVGFRREGLLQHAGVEGEGMVAMAMLRQSCRWLPRTFLHVPATRISQPEPI